MKYDNNVYVCLLKYVDNLWQEAICYSKSKREKDREIYTMSVLAVVLTMANINVG